MKKGQFQIGFSMIFSIILIVVFLVVAFIAIRAFLGTQCDTEQGLFLKDLQKEIDRLWKGAGGEYVFKEKISSCKLEYVCFWDYESESFGDYERFTTNFLRKSTDKGPNNIYFYKREDSGIKSSTVYNINMSNFRNNPECFRKVEDEFQIKLNKNLNEALVRVS